MGGHHAPANSFSLLGFEIHGKLTRGQRFLNEMDAIVPRRKLCRLIEPHYHKGNCGRPLIGIDHFLPVWVNLSLEPNSRDLRPRFPLDTAVAVGKTTGQVALRGSCLARRSRGLALR